jgi:hypothetical protein
MDPYLEGGLWTSFHTQFAVEVARTLSPRLWPRYAALTEKKYIPNVGEDSSVFVEHLQPDVGVAETGFDGFSGQAVALATPLETISLVPEAVPHVWVEIRDVEQRELITCIEFLSPTNKRSEGREEYLRKRNTLLRSATNLLEIDFIRQGQRLPLKDVLPHFPYFVFLSRAARRPVTEYWPIALSQHLPTVPVPLRDPDPDVPLDLQEVFASVYDAFGYAFLIDYGKEAEPGLPPESATWAEGLLRAAGKRT